MVDIRDKEKMEAVLTKYKKKLEAEFEGLGVAIFVYEVDQEKASYISYVTNTTSDYLFYLINLFMEQRKLLAQKFTSKQ